MVDAENVRRRSEILRTLILLSRERKRLEEELKELESPYSDTSKRGLETGLPRLGL